MQRTWKRAAALAVVVLFTLALTADVEARHRHGGSCGSSGGYNGGYTYSGGYGGGYAHGGNEFGEDEGYTGGWTTVTQPVYRRGLFGRRIFVGNQVVSVPAASEAAPQTAARTEAEMDRSARLPDARPQAEFDRATPATENEFKPRNSEATPATPRDEDAVPPPRSTEATPQNNRDDNAVPPPPSSTPLIP
jgi:hypothetical protein